jgi:tetratricopeptide (TPR) repeat protein
LVGLAGPWICGGIEFNWPQHHRPNTFGPVEYQIGRQSDGSRTVWFSEIERMCGMKMTAGFTLYPGKAYLEVRVQLYNRTAEPQTFLWWANPAVPANEQTQSIFPPDVHAVFDHGRRDVSAFPIATGTYYKVDYSAGVDISRYKNIPVPTSYMAYRSDYDFVGGYDHGRRAGILHVANHHVSPGKKQWTWGCGDFGRAWERNLTDEDGPYIELMTGVYTDNQPDFAWLQPYEEKSFTQYFMPYKDIGVVKNASVDAALNLDVDDARRTARLQVYVSSVFADALITLTGRSRAYVDTTLTLTPERTFATEVSLDAAELPTELVATVKDARGATLVAYRPAAADDTQLPEPAQPLPEPAALGTNEALYLAGLHLEQYRHATFAPDAYYLEGLRREPGDIRINVAYGTLLLRRGLLRESELHLRAAVASLTRHNPNPYDGEAYYQLGLTLRRQGRPAEACAAFYKAVWSAAWQDSGYFSLAQLACEQHAFTQALELLERSLLRNARNYKARDLKTALLRKLGRLEEAQRLAVETSELDVADFGAYNELYLLHLARGEKERALDALDALKHLMRGDVHNFITLALDYCHCGLYAEGVDVLLRLLPNAHQDAYPMLHYYLAYCYAKLSRPASAQAHLLAASAATPDYCFPNSLDDLAALENAVSINPGDARAHYYLGNLLYDKRRQRDAIRHWEVSREACNTFATVHRNLALAYYNVLGLPEQALFSLERAFALDPGDARVFYELDQLHRRQGFAPAARLASLESHPQLVRARDDLYLEYITLLNCVQRHAEALALLAERTFHPWEGGEGKVTGQYILAHVELGKRYLGSRQGRQALATLKQALDNPLNLAEGRLGGAQEDELHYYLGCAYALLGQDAQAAASFGAAAQGLAEPASALFYNDQPLHMLFYQGLACLKLGDIQEARHRFESLIAYGERHLRDDVSIDYFAVSLPDFLVFEDDLNWRNRVHCLYMQGLGHLGLHDFARASAFFSAALELDANHQGALIHLAMASGEHRPEED